MGFYGESRKKRFANWFSCMGFVTICAEQHRCVKNFKSRRLCESHINLATAPKSLKQGFVDLEGL